MTDKPTNTPSFRRFVRDEYLPAVLPTMHAECAPHRWLESVRRGSASITLARVLILVGAMFAAGCATPVTYHPSLKPVTYDKNTEYTLVENPNGFELAVYYETFQFFPAQGAVAEVCRSTGTSLAHGLAQRRGKSLKPINPERVRVTIGRNGFTGVTSCSALVPAEYAM